MGSKLSKILVGVTLCMQTSPMFAGVKVVKGAVYPNPFEDTVSIDLYNEGDQDVSCDITVEATAVSGNGSGPFKGVVTSDPVTKILRSRRDYTHNIPFSKAMNNIRNKWHDSSTVIAEVVPSGVTFSCEPIDGGGGGLGELFTHEKGIYMIKSRWSGKCLNLQVPDLSSSEGFEPGVPVITYDCPPQNNKWRNNYWRVEKYGDNNLLVSDFSHRIINMKGGLEQGDYYSSSGLSAQYLARVKFRRVDGGYHLAYHVYKDGFYCVTVQGYDNHSSVKGERCSAGRTDQIWDLQEAYTN